MRDRLWVGFLVGVGVVAALRQATTDPTALDGLWLLAAWGAVAANVLGIVVHRPARPGPWILTAIGLSATGLAGLVVPASLELPANGVRAGVGNLLHVASYLLIGGAVLWFVRLQAPERDRESLIDGVLVAVALATVLWTVVIDPNALGADASVTGRVMYVVAPILPAGVTAVCVRLLFAAGDRVASARLLGGAWVLAFVGTIGWILMLQADTFAPGGWPDLVWVAALGCAGASALHPSMDEMSRPTTVHRWTVSRARLTVLGAALLATPVALLTSIGVTAVHVAVPVAAAGLVALLVLVRLARLVREREQTHAELEVRAARQEVVARLAEAALSGQDVTALDAEAAELVSSAIDDVEVRIHPDGAPDDGGDGVVLHRLAVTGSDGTRATIDVLGAAGRDLTVDERAFLTSVAAVLSAFTVRREAEDDLRRRAMYDGLTGLPNRALVLERLGQAVRQRDRGAVGVLFVDLDGFKPVNDTYGHDAGDALLVELGRRLHDVVRVGDTIGRYAGDEFVVVVPTCDEAGLAELAARVLHAVRQPIEVRDTLVAVTASVGGTLAGPHESDPRELIRRADAAMYAAKDMGDEAVILPDRGAVELA